MIRRLTATALTLLVLACTAQAISKRPPALDVGSVPQFQIRARVTGIGGLSPSTKIFTYRWGKQLVKVQGNAWSPWFDFTTSFPAKRLQQFSTRWHQQSLIRMMIQVNPAVDPTLVTVQVRFAQSNHTFDLHGDLFGPSLGIMIWRGAGTGVLRAATLAGYNERYWQEFDAVALRPSEKPKHFLIVDRFIGGDNDRLDWEEGISHLAKTGITAMNVPASGPIRSMLLKNGLRRIALGAGIAGGPLGLRTNAAQIQKWSSGFASRYFKAGYQPDDFSLFALADEPGWYFPMVFHPVDINPSTLEKFRKYLAQQHLSPAMLGASTWDEVFPIGHSKVSPSAPLDTRRLFYWTCRFFPWAAAEHIREGTIQLHHAFTPELKTFANWNNFAGQYYYEGFRANNPDFTSPDEAMGSPDWFEFGRMHAADLLWTEDWFGNDRAYQWSFYAAKFRSIASKDDLGFGGYVIGQTAGKPADGMLQKILTLVGNGAKAIFYYNFGPAYNFPGNCYSEVPGVPTQHASADKMIAKAEDVLWPGREPQAHVAILEPRSSDVWDGLHIFRGLPVVGATNTNLNGTTLDYMAEEFDEYLALEMSDIPADFVSEDGLADGTLNNYKVLYVTEPDIPVGGQRAIVQWVKGGGTLAMVPGAAQGDRYDEPVTNLTSLSGSPRHSRTYLPNLLTLKRTETIGNVPVFGGPPCPAPVGKAISFFSDKVPAIQQDNVGSGSVMYYTYFPGLSYAHLAIDAKLGLHQSPESDVLRKLVLMPVQTAGIAPPVRVDTSYVETPMLVSSAGAAITLLNWTGHDLSSVRVAVHLPFPITRAESVTRGSIKLRHADDVVTFSLPLGAADIIKLSR